MFNFQGNSVWHGKWSLIPKEKKKKKTNSTLGQNQTKPFSFNED